MNLQTVNNKMNVLMHERLRLQRAYSAANSMMFQLQIPEGKHLVFVLNQPEALDNKEAISRWLLDQNKCVAIDEVAYASLKEKLQQLLTEACGAGF